MDVLSKRLHESDGENPEDWSPGNNQFLPDSIASNRRSGSSHPTDSPETPGKSNQTLDNYLDATREAPTSKATNALEL